VKKLTNGYCFRAVRQYRLTMRKSNTDSPRGQVLVRATTSATRTSFCRGQLRSGSNAMPPQPSLLVEQAHGPFHPGIYCCKRGITSLRRSP
jgi:hypothetical protein